MEFSNKVAIKQDISNLNISISRQSNGGFALVITVPSSNYGSEADLASFSNADELSEYVKQLVEKLDIPQSKNFK